MSLNLISSGVSRIATDVLGILRFVPPRYVTTRFVSVSSMLLEFTISMYLFNIESLPLNGCVNSVLMYGLGVGAGFCPSKNFRLLR